jgi:hypothetical protein
MSEQSSNSNQLDQTEVVFPRGAVHIDFLFIEHNSPRNLPEEFGGLVAEADIVSIEAVNWSRRGAYLRQAIADGDPEALAEMSRLLPLNTQGGLWRRIHKGLFDSQVKVHSPEAPEHHPVANAYLTALQEETRFLKLHTTDLAANEPTTLRNLAKMLDSMMATIAERDKYTLQHFFPAETLQSDSDVRLLAIFGLAHRVLAPAIVRQAEGQGRSDISMSITEKGTTNVSSYTKFLRGEKLTPQDAAEYYGL